MAVVTMRQLLESGVHFGHQTRRWNPKMKRFIMTERNGIYIIDLQQSLTYINSPTSSCKETVAHGGTILFVGTKKQAQEPIAEQATRVGMPYVNHRWLGGMLTNFQTPSQAPRAPEGARGDRLRRGGRLRLHQEGTPHPAAREGQAGEDARRHPRHGQGALGRLDRRHQEGAPRGRRGRKLGLPVIAILDTNCDPDEVDYKIPGNDDAIRSVTLLTRVIADAVADGLIQRSHARANAGPPTPVSPRTSRWPSGSASSWAPTRSRPPRPPPPTRLRRLRRRPSRRRSTRRGGRVVEAAADATEATEATEQA
jgi:small subunit ribosomal protein S2